MRELQEYVDNYSHKENERYFDFLIKIEEHD